MYSINKIGLFDLSGQVIVNKILYDCGKDMAHNYGLYHWNNSYIKNAIIVALCELKNDVYIVSEDSVPVATFQIRKIDNCLHFEKLATHPSAAGKGVGSFCMYAIENMAKDANCRKICLEVYSHSEHARKFYDSKGYIVCGETNTLKYSEIKMEKMLQ